MSSTNSPRRGAPPHPLSDCGGPGAGQRTLTLRSPALARPFTPKPLADGLTADLQVFSLNAAVACTAVQRSKLEGLAGYVARPAIALERLAVGAAGRVVLELSHSFRDACHPATPRRCNPQAPAVQGARGVFATKSAGTEGRRPAGRAHDLGGAV